MIPSTHIRLLFFSVIFQLFFGFENLCQVRSSHLAKNTWIKITLTDEMSNHVASLEDIEKLEQYRDWIKFSIINTIKFNTTTNFEVLYDFNPLRSDYARNFSNYSFGEGRYIIGPKDSLYIIVPFDSPKKETITAQMADNFRLITGKKPGKVLLLEYKIDTSNRSASFAYTADIIPSDLFSEKYNYFETLVATRNDLSGFIRRVDDLVFASFQAGMLYLGGRKYASYNGKKADIEDIAVIYQAGNKLYENEMQRLSNRGLVTEYDESIEETIEYNIRKDPMFLVRYSRAELEELARQKFTYEDFVLNFLSLTKKRADELNVGFSLDPSVKYREMYDSLNAIVKGETNSLRRLFKNEIEKALKESYLEVNKESSGYIRSFFTKENSLSTLIAIDTVGEEEITGAGDLGMSAFLEKSYSGMLKSVQKNKPVLRQILQQLNSEKSGKQLLLFHYLNAYLRGDYVLDIRGPVNESWNPEKKVIYKRALADLSEVLYNLGYIDEKDHLNYDSMMVRALRLLNYDYYLGIKDFSTLDERKLTRILKCDTTKLTELLGLQLFLSNVIKPYKYQKARYDGDFKGTKVGMTLFYTDLIMKLWSFAYGNSMPETIPGFYAQTNYRISSLYQDEIKKNPYTRSWLGPLLSSVELYNGGKQVYFSNIATRIYNASSSDLVPGIEVPAHMSSDRFSNWWNLHYAEVAEYETEYHRLNQIMKWSFLIPWLKTKNMLGWLDLETGITRNLDFSTWYQKNKSLRVNTSLPFLNKDSLKETTECIDILNSRPFRWFKENDLEYVFSGGISLVNKTTVLKKISSIKSAAITIRPLNRPGLTRTLNDQNGYIIGGTQYNLSPAQAKVAVRAVKNDGFKGRESEFYNLNIKRSIRSFSNKLEVDQTTGDANIITIGGVSAERINNEIKLSALQNDVNTYKNFFVNDNLLNYSKVSQKKVYVDNNTFIMKLENTNCWAVGKEVKESEIRQLKTTISSQPHFTYSNGYMVSDIQFVSDADMASGRLNNGWFKINKSAYAKVEYVQHSPGRETNRLFLSDGNYVNEVIVEPAGMFIKQKKFNIDEPVAYALSSYDAPAIIDAVTLLNSRAYIVNENRLISLMMANLPDHSELGTLKALLPEKSGIKVILVRPGSTVIKFIKPGILEVPDIAHLSEGQREVLKYVMQKSSDFNWTKVFESASSISNGDIKVLSQISDENSMLAASYYKLKSLTNLDEATAVVDLQSFSKKPQVLIRTGSAKPEVKTINGSQSMTEIIAGIKKMYQEQESSLTYDDLLHATQPYADMLEQVCNVTSAKNIITMEPTGINSEVIKRLHNISPEKTLFKDQPEVASSIGNLDKIISVNFEKAVILMTVNPSEKGFTIVNTLVDSLHFYGMKLSTRLTSNGFLAILRDTSVRQINLVARGNKYGIVFADGLLDYWTLKNELSYLYRRNKKDLIYVISNMADTLETVLASYPVFSRIITSTFLNKDRESFDEACVNLQRMYSKVYNEQLLIPVADWKKMKEANPGLTPSLGDFVKQANRQTTIKVGMLSSDRIKSVPEALWDYFSGRLGNAVKPYTPKNLDNIFREVQMEKLQQLITEPIKLRAEKFFRSIPVLKV